MARYELRQELFDPEMAPVLDYCCKCGGEIYSANDGHYDPIFDEWTCDECYYELYDSEEEEEEDG